jgi:hypothetical protein
MKVTGWNYNSATAVPLFLSVDGANTFLNLGGGNVAIGNVAPPFQLTLSTDSAGKPNGGSWANTSDARVKKNIQPLNGALDTLTQLRGVSFEWVNPADHANQTGRQAGFVAQGLRCGSHDLGHYLDKVAVMRATFARLRH